MSKNTYGIAVNVLTGVAIAIVIAMLVAVMHVISLNKQLNSLHELREKYERCRQAKFEEEFWPHELYTIHIRDSLQNRFESYIVPVHGVRTYKLPEGWDENKETRFKAFQDVVRRYRLDREKDNCQTIK